MTAYPGGSDFGGRGYIDTGLLDKVVLVTGGTRGIGAAITRRFAATGSYVAFNGRNHERARALIDGMGELGGRMTFLYADLTDGSQCERLVEEAAEFGRRVSTDKSRGVIDVLVCCAGNNDNVGAGSDREAIRRSLDLNLGHYVHVTGRAFPYLVDSRGNVVYIGSKTGTFGQAESWAYSASNAGINGLVVAVANKGAPHGVRANVVVPAEVDGVHYREWAADTFPGRGPAAMAEIAGKIPLGGRMTTEEEIADSVLLLASNKLSPHTTGTQLLVDGGFPRLV